MTANSTHWVQAITTSDQEYILVIYCLALIFSFFASILMMKLSIDKIKDIKNPNKHSSYSIFSVHMLYIGIFSLFLILILDIMQAYFIWRRTIIKPYSMDDADQTYIIFIYIYHLNIQTCAIMLFYQTFEWVTMLYIIGYQRDKSLGEITYILNNNKKYRKFRQNEYFLRFLYFVIVVLYFCFEVDFYAYATSVLAMIITLMVLLVQLRKFHHYEYLKNRKTLVRMCLFISIYQLFMFYHAWNIATLKKAFIDHVLLPLFYLGFFKLYVVIILVYLKPAKDPLEGISKLDLLILVSIN